MSQHLPNEESLGRLLQEFFLVFGSPEMLDGKSISLVNGICQQRKTYQSDVPYLELLCPISQRCVNTFLPSCWRDIAGELTRAREFMLEGRSLEDLCQDKKFDPDTEKQQNMNNTEEKQFVNSPEAKQVVNYTGPSVSDAIQQLVKSATADAVYRYTKRIY